MGTKFAILGICLLASLATVAFLRAKYDGRPAEAKEDVSTTGKPLSHGDSEDGLFVIARWPNEQSHIITMQDFYKPDGRNFIAIWSDEQHFRDENSGNQFEHEGVWIKRSLLKELLKGNELLILNPGSARPREMRKADL